MTPTIKVYPNVGVPPVETLVSSLPFIASEEPLPTDLIATMQKSVGAAEAVDPRQIIRDYSRFGLLNMGSLGMGLVTTGKLLPGELILYTGRVSDLTGRGGDRVLYGFALTDKKVLDAENCGSIARYIQHLPTSAELADFYTLADGVAEEIAEPNLTKTFVVVDGNYYIAHKVVREIDGSVEKPVLLGYSYGYENYFYNANMLAKLLRRDGSLINCDTYHALQSVKIPHPVRGEMFIGRYNRYGAMRSNVLGGVDDPEPMLGSARAALVEMLDLPNIPIGLQFAGTFINFYVLDAHGKLARIAANHFQKLDVGAIDERSEWYLAIDELSDLPAHRARFSAFLQHLPEVYLIILDKLYKEPSATECLRAYSKAQVYQVLIEITSRELLQTLGMARVRLAKKSEPAVIADIIAVMKQCLALLPSLKSYEKNKRLRELCALGDESAVRNLIEKEGADPNAVDNLGRNAAHYTVMRQELMAPIYRKYKEAGYPLVGIDNSLLGHEGVMRVLIEHRVNFSAKNSNGNTPLDIATRVKAGGKGTVKLDVAVAAKLQALLAAVDAAPSAAGGAASSCSASAAGGAASYYTASVMAHSAGAVADESAARTP
jgi:hypothetical protein